MDNRLELYLCQLGLELNIPHLEARANEIRHIVAEDIAADWQRAADAAMERRARLNGPHKGSKSNG